jgi:membrane associated rhomboid family serine protease
MARRPWVNYLIIGINVGLFVLGYSGANPAIYRWMLLPQSPELVQFFTSMFLHANLMHLVGNMLFLWVFGNAINDRLGPVGYLAFYLGGGVSAAIGYMVLSSNAPVLGASGAISAVAGAYLVLLPRTRVTVVTPLFAVLIPFEISSLYFLLFQFLWNVFMSTPGGAGGQVAYVAHSSGYVYGIAVSAVLLATGILPRDSFDLLNLVKSWNRRRRYQRMVSKGYDPFSYVNPNLKNENGQWVKVEQKTTDTDTTEARELLLRREISEVLGRHDLEGACKRYMELVQLSEDPVLPQAQQLDIANYLMAQERYAPAADAYERLMKHHKNYEFPGDICLMLGLIYGRYLQQRDLAENNLRRAVDLLTDPRKQEMARNELNALSKR